MLRLTQRFANADRRTRHHNMLDGQINPREWFNWHMKEYQPWHYDRHKFLYEQMQWAHVHHLLCQQVYLKDVQQLAACPEPTTMVIDTRMNTTKMHRWVPNSIWIPRDEVDYALQLSQEEFLSMYGVRKPALNEDIVLISHDGHASEQAGWEFRKAFYTHVYNFRGGCNELFGESYADFAPVEKLKPWKGPFPQNGIYVDKYSKRKVLTRTGPFDRQYEMEEAQLPDLDAEKARHTSDEDGLPRQDRPWGLQ